jgi:pilus assembly protein CpaE
MSALPPSVHEATADQLRTLRVAVVVDPATASPLSAAVLASANLHLHLVPLAELDPALPFMRQADVVIVEVQLDRAGELETFARIVAEQPRPVIAAARALTAGAVRSLMRAGAVDAVALPLDLGDLAEALDAAQRLLTARPQAAAKGRVISFLRAVGGAGATAIATQIGCLWSSRQTTCLIDFDLQFGAVALYLDMQPPLGMLDLIEARDRLDHTLFATITARHTSGLTIIAAPRDIAPLESLTPAIVAQILTLAAQSFEVVLVDLPAAWTPWSLAALAHSDAACLVTNLSVPGLRQARRQLDLIEANGVSAPLKIVLNRVPKTLFRTIDMGDSERVLRRPVDFTIANDFATMTNAIDQGRPISSIRSRSPLEADLNGLIAGLTTVLAA